MNEKLLLNEIPARNGYATGVPLPDQSDDEIIERVLNGDLDAFEILVRRYDRWVRGIVSKHAARDQVADIAQDVFIQAYKSLPNHCPNTSFQSCLAKIAARCCCDHYRAVNRHPTCAISNLNLEDMEQMEQSLQATACETAHSEMELDRMREELLPVMEQLEADDRSIMWLLYWQNHSLQETAAILGYSPGNVKARASRARALLRQRMVPAAITEQPPMPVNVYQAEGMTAVL